MPVHLRDKDNIGEIKGRGEKNDKEQKERPLAAQTRPYPLNSL